MPIRILEENVRLKAQLRYQARTAMEAPFGSATPSAKLISKANSLAPNPVIPVTDGNHPSP